MKNSGKQTADNQNTNRTKTYKKRKHHTLLRRLVLVIAGILIGTNIYLFNARGIVGNQLPMPFGYGIANVLSGSMEPTFSKGTLLLVKKTGDIQVGDIVVYQSGQELIVHRVIGLDAKSNMVVTQGDANSVADEAFSKNEVKGVVVTWIPFLGNLVSILRTPAGILLILVIAFLLVERSFRKQREADGDELDAIKEEIRRLKAEQCTGAGEKSEHESENKLTGKSEKISVEKTEETESRD